VLGTNPSRPSQKYSSDGEHEGYCHNQRDPGWKGPGFATSFVPCSVLWLFSRPGCVIGNAYGTHEPVALARDGLNEIRVFGRILQNFAQTVDRLIQAQLKIDESAGWPETPDQLFTGNHVPRLFQQSCENLEGFFLKVNPLSVEQKFGCTQVELKLAEAHDTLGFGWNRHRTRPHTDRRRESVALAE